MPMAFLYVDPFARPSLRFACGMFRTSDRARLSDPNPLNGGAIEPLGNIADLQLLSSPGGPAQKSASALRGRIRTGPSTRDPEACQKRLPGQPGDLYTRLPNLLLARRASPSAPLQVTGVPAAPAPLSHLGTGIGALARAIVRSESLMEKLRTRRLLQLGAFSAARFRPACSGMHAVGIVFAVARDRSQSAAELTLRPRAPRPRHTGTAGALRLIGQRPRSSSPVSRSKKPKILTCFGRGRVARTCVALQRCLVILSYCKLLPRRPP